MAKQPKVDDYIDKANDFAKPILNRLRDLIHKAIPDVTETIKWGMPFFEYHGNLCHIAAFKQHCAFGFWKGSLMKDPKKILTCETAMGHLGRIATLDDLPSDAVILEYIKHAADLNKTGIKKTAKLTKKKPVETPDDLLNALKENPHAKKTYLAFSESQKREYVDWLEDAKRPETREKRLLTTLEWLEEGKHRLWKYERPLTKK